MKKLLTMLTVAAAAGMLALALIGTASAHAPYDSSTPAKGAVLTMAPTSVVVNFQEDIQKTAGSFGVTVAMDGGGSVTPGPATASGRQLTVPLQSGLAAGRYVVNWNNTAADDGDPLARAFSFYINTQPTAAQLAADQQLASIESNTLATATAEAAQAALTAAAAAPTTAPAAGTTPRAATSSAANLPKTGTGPTGSTNYGWLFVATAAAIALSGTVLLAASVRRGRSR